MTEELVFRNPGEKLRDLLGSIFAYDPTTENSVFSRMDEAVLANGELALLAHSSLVSYLTRRLITAAEYIKRKYNNEGYPDGFYIQKIRDYLIEQTRLPSDQREKILAMLLECLSARSRKVPVKTKQRMRTIAQKDGLKCYICGCDMDFSLRDEYLAAIIEHVWPNSMGGDRHETNLRVSCKKCSDNKHNYMESSDFHYEEICLVDEEGSEDFNKKLTRQHKIAVWTKSGYSCILCGKPASEGTLGFARRNINDNWHFLNMDAYCDEHLAQINSLVRDNS